MRTPEHQAREGQRDLRFANVADPAPRGAERSSVSEVSLTKLAHERLAAAGGRPSGGPAAGRSADLDASLRAATLPPGQSRTAGDTGARPQTGGQTPRGTERNGPGGRGQ